MKSIPFFKKFGNFCKKMEREIGELQEKCEAYPGTRPENYDRAMEHIKREIDDLNTNCDSALEECAEIENLTDFRRNLEELINANKQQIWNAEEHMKKYGYKPPTEEKFLFLEEKENILESQHKEARENSLYMETPQLPKTSFRKVDKSAVKTDCKYDEVPEIFSAKKSHRKLECEDRVNKHLSSPFQEFMTPVVASLNQVQNNVVANSPYNTYDSKSYYSQKKVESTLRSNRKFQYSEPETPEEPFLSDITKKLFVDVKSVANNLKNVYDADTPEEPALSEVTQKLFKVEVKNVDTPEEPVLSEVTQRMYKVEVKNVDTPEEPALSEVTQRMYKVDVKHSYTPEEPVLSEIKQRMYKIDVEHSYTPEEPVLSEINQRMYKVDIKHSDFPEERAIFLDSNKRLEIYESPMEPVISEATRKLLRSLPQKKLEEPNIPQVFVTEEKEEDLDKEGTIETNTSYCTPPQNKSNMNEFNKSTVEFMQTPVLSDITRSFLSNY